MSKENKQFFRHDIGASSDPKLVELYVQGLGNEGYGIYWRLVEILYQEGGSYPINKISTLSYSLDRVEIEKIKTVIEIAFKTDGEYFYSDRINAQLDNMKKQSEQNRKNQQKRWEKQEIEKGLKRYHELIADGDKYNADSIKRILKEKYNYEIEG